MKGLFYSRKWGGQNWYLTLYNDRSETWHVFFFLQYKRKYNIFVRILLTLPDSFPPSSSWHQMLCKNVIVALVDYLYQWFYALNMLYGTCVTCEFWFSNGIWKRRLENALLTEQIERQVLFCTVTSRLLHDDAKIHVTLARLYNVLKNWREMKTVFRQNILIRTDDLLILFDTSIRYD